MPTIDELKAKQAAGETLTAEELEMLNQSENTTDADGEGEFDKDRAMSTIKKLREFEKAAKAQLKELEALKKAENDRKQAEMTDLQKAQSELETIKPEIETLREQNRELLTQTAFERTVGTLKLEFATEKARETGYRLLDKEKVGEDAAGMKDALLALQKEHAYLFTRIVVPETDARQKGKTSGDQLVNDAATSKRAAYGSL